jgi:lysozyme family protein
MTKVELLAPKILQWEGGFVDDPVDMGGATNMGITLTTYRQVFGENRTVEELKSMSICDFSMILKHFYWDRWRADEILNQSIAEILVDWVWGSGKWGIIIPQRKLGIPDDGVVGPKTIMAVNSVNQQEFHQEIVEARISFINSLILNHPEQEKFRKGWTNRINSYKFE